MANGTMKLFQEYNTNTIPTSQAFIRKGYFNSVEIINVFCNMLFDAKQDPLLKAFLAELYDRYKKTTHSDRITMSDYFKIEEDNLCMVFVRGAANSLLHCLSDHEVPLKQLRPTLLGNLIYFKDMMNNVESFLQTTRLDGRFFR